MDTSQLVAGGRERSTVGTTSALVADGTVVTVRPITPDDGERLVAFHARLSFETTRLRFFSPHPILSSVEVTRFTHVDGHDRAAIVAVRDDGIIGVARFDRKPETNDAEVAFVVEDGWQGKGIGSLLLEHLTARARQEGVERFTADTLFENRRMLDVFRATGQHPRTRLEHGVVHLVFPIATTPESRAAVEHREHVSEARSVQRMLAPRSVAVVGASERMGSIGRALVDNIVNGGFGGPIYPVHPTAEAVGGLPAYPSVADIPDDVDVAIVAVPATQVVKVAHDCGRKGVFGLVIISAGFAEAGESGAAVQRELVAVARNYGMRIIGPNCLGVVNTSPTVALHATFGSVEPPAGRIGLLSQSGAIGIVVLDAAVKTGLGVSTFVSAGNKADLSGNDLLQYWEDDDDTDVVMLYLESFGNPRKFARLARRVSRSKPIVVVKSGRTAAGRRAASSHTAALATPDDAVDALFRQAGVLRVDNVRTMFGVGRVLAHQPLPAGRRVAIIGNSGGPGILAADACATADLTIPDLSPDTQARLSAILPPSAAVANPVDLLAGAGPQQYDAVISAVLDDDVVDAAVVIFTPTSVTTAEAVGAAVAVAAGRSSKPVVAAFLTVEDGDIVVPSTRTVPRFSAAEDAVFALGRVADYADWRRRPVGEVPEFSDVEPARAEAVITGALAESPEGRWLDATEGREVLEAYRIRQVTTLVAEDLADALCIASEIGYPVALKAGGTEIVHKSEEGAVALDIGNAEALSAAWERMAQRLGARFTSGVMQPMVPRGTETLMGITSDPLFGPIVVFGLGGTVTELVGDRTIRLLPLTTDDAAEMLHSLRMSPLLFGYRGSEPVDAAALSSMLLRLSQLAEGNPEIVELDLNPVVAMHDGAVVLDAKVRVAPAIRTELPLRQLRSS